MTFYEDHHNTIYNMDFRENDLPPESVQMVCTSPPFWGLRKYLGQQELIWGGLDECDHQWITEQLEYEIRTGKGLADWSIKYARGGGHSAGQIDKIIAARGFCLACGAWKGAYGLEPTPEMYVQHTVEMLRHIRRVLRKDGVVWWNIDDACAGSTGGSLKPKDLCLIPFRVAIAAQEDGWWVRSVIIWSKPNTMPESVKDRPTESHEYILMLTKSARYYYDQEAVRGEYRQSSVDRADGSKVTTSNPDRPVAFERILGTGPNLRSVWEFPTSSGPGKEIRNFAVYPERLPEICIKAATPEEGCCSQCGKPWHRILEKQPSQFNIRVRDAKAGRATPEEGYKATQEEIDGYPGNHPDPGYRKTVGWKPTCKCNADKVPATVLDPFVGSGTTLWVAKRLNRQGIGFDISEEYCQLSVDRCRQQVML